MSCQGVDTVRLTAEQKVRRDEEIARDRARGYGWPVIAERHELTIRQCQNIWRQRLASVELSLDDPAEHVKEAIACFDAVAEDCLVVFESSKNEAIKLGAVKARLAALTVKFELLQSVGLLPHLRLALDEREVRDLLDGTLAILRKHNLPPAVLNELAALAKAA